MNEQSFGVSIDLKGSISLEGLYSLIGVYGSRIIYKSNGLISDLNVEPPLV